MEVWVVLEHSSSLRPQMPEQVSGSCEDTKQTSTVKAQKWAGFVLVYPGQRRGCIWNSESNAARKEGSSKRGGRKMTALLLVSPSSKPPKPLGAQRNPASSERFLALRPRRSSRGPQWPATLRSTCPSCALQWGCSFACVWVCIYIYMCIHIYIYMQKTCCCF